MNPIDWTIQIGRDGDQWCALVGEDLQSGTAGFGSTIAEAVTQLTQEMEQSGAWAAAVVEAVPSPDTKRLQHLEDWLDGFEFVHLPTQIEPEVRCDWFAGDGSGHWFTQGKTFREAIDKSLNHEATQEAND